MSDFSFSSIDELKILLRDKKFTRILVICGESSFKKSGANKIINNLLINKNVDFYFKKLPHPNQLELQKIIDHIKKFTPKSKKKTKINGNLKNNFSKKSQKIMLFEEDLLKEKKNSNRKRKKDGKKKNN